VVNNAGILRDGIFHRMSADDWLSVIAVHLNGSFFVSRAAAEHFRVQESGAFVHITSTSGLVGNIGQANYAAAKLGITALSKSIALDMARYNVRSNCLSPWAWSRMTSSIPTNTPEQAAAVEKLKQMTPDKNAPLGPCCTEVVGSIDGAHPINCLYDPDVVRASEHQHPVQGRSSDGNLGRLRFVSSRA
jgi:NAD(P)-dependent dehydrogenase (short-subunit alcohol dehydrogenase family)